MSDDLMYVVRNRAFEFAMRTKANLEFMQAARAQGADVHEVTQLANSLLGLVVFVWEKVFVEDMKQLRMKDLERKGWPRISVTKGTSETLYDFVRHLRNAVAHGRLTFSSDSRDPRKVIIEIDDCKAKETIPYWSARMKADDLRAFCFKFIDLVECETG